MPKELFEGQQIEALPESEPKYVKIIVFDDQSRVLVIKRGTRYVLPGGCVEWDDDDAEDAARREAFETANIVLGVVKPVTIIKTNDRNQGTQTIVFVGRMAGEGSAWPEQRQTRRFMAKKTFFGTSGGQSDLVYSLVEAAYRVLISKEIEDEYADAIQAGREKYNLCSLL